MERFAPTRPTIVITGFGVVTPIGVGRVDFERNLFAGSANFRPIELFDTSPFTWKSGGAINELNADLYLGRRSLKSMSRSALLACIGTTLAIQEAKLTLSSQDRSRIAVAFGTAFGSLTSVFDFDAEAVAEGKRYVDAMNFPNTVMNAPAGYAAALWGLTGVNVTLSTGFSSGLEAVRHGMQLLTNHQADIVLAGGYEQLSPLTWGAFERSGRLKKQGDAWPSPFDQVRTGFVPSEGAAVFVLERRDDVIRRKAPILAELRGVGVGVVEPQTQRSSKVAAIVKALTQAIEEAHLAPSDLDGVIASANGSVEDDQIEAEAIVQAVGTDMPVTAPKSILGESAGAAGALGLACAISSLAHGRLSPTVGFSSGDPGQRIKVVTEATNGRRCATLLVDAVDTGSKTLAVVVNQGAVK